MGGLMLRVVVVTGLVLAFPVVALAQSPVAEVEEANAFAQENFDLGDYEAARDHLIAAVAKLKRAGLSRDPVAAQTHALLGLAHARIGDDAAADKAFRAALAIDAAVVLPDAYSTDHARALFAKASVAATAAAKPAVVDCDALQGLAHELIGGSDAGAPVAITAHAGGELVGATIVAMYATEGAAEFTELTLARGKGCAFRGELPADAVQAGTIRYYIAAKNAAGKLLASKGRASSPFSIVVRAPADPGGSAATTVGEGGEAVEDEVPDELQPVRPSGPKRGGCAGCDVGAQQPRAPWLAFALGVTALAIRRRRRR